MVRQERAPPAPRSGTAGAEDGVDHPGAGGAAVGGSSGGAGAAVGRGGTGGSIGSGAVGWAAGHVEVLALVSGAALSLGLVLDPRQVRRPS